MKATVFRFPILGIGKSTTEIRHIAGRYGMKSLLPDSNENLNKLNLSVPFLPFLPLWSPSKHSQSPSPVYPSQSAQGEELKSLADDLKNGRIGIREGRRERDLRTKRTMGVNEKESRQFSIAEDERREKRHEANFALLERWQLRGGDIDVLIEEERKDKEAMEAEETNGEDVREDEISGGPSKKEQDDEMSRLIAVAAKEWERNQEEKKVQQSTLVAVLTSLSSKEIEKEIVEKEKEDEEKLASVPTDLPSTVSVGEENAVETNQVTSDDSSKIGDDEKGDFENAVPPAIVPQVISPLSLDDSESGPSSTTLSEEKEEKEEEVDAKLKEEIEEEVQIEMEEQIVKEESPITRLSPLIISVPEMTPADSLTRLPTPDPSSAHEPISFHPFSENQEKKEEDDHEPFSFLNSPAPSCTDRSRSTDSAEDETVKAASSASGDSVEENADMVERGEIKEEEQELTSSTASSSMKEEEEESAPSPSMFDSGDDCDSLLEGGTPPGSPPVEEEDEATPSIESEAEEEVADENPELLEEEEKSPSLAVVTGVEERKPMTVEGTMDDAAEGMELEEVENHPLVIESISEISEEKEDEGVKECIESMLESLCPEMNPVCSPMATEDDAKKELEEDESADSDPEPQEKQEIVLPQMAIEEIPSEKVEKEGASISDDTSDEGEDEDEKEASAPTPFLFDSAEDCECSLDIGTPPGSPLEEVAEEKEEEESPSSPAPPLTPSLHWEPSTPVGSPIAEHGTVEEPVAEVSSPSKQLKRKPSGLELLLANYGVDDEEDEGEKKDNCASSSPLLAPPVDDGISEKKEVEEEVIEGVEPASEAQLTQTHDSVAVETVKKEQSQPPLLSPQTAASRDENREIKEEPLDDYEQLPPSSIFTCPSCPATFEKRCLMRAHEKTCASVLVKEELDQASSVSDAPSSAVSRRSKKSRIPLPPPDADGVYHCEFQDCGYAHKLKSAIARHLSQTHGKAAQKDLAVRTPREVKKDDEAEETSLPASISESEDDLPLASLATKGCNRKRKREQSPPPPTLIAPSSPVSAEMKPEHLPTATPKSKKRKADEESQEATTPPPKKVKKKNEMEIEKEQVSTSSKSTTSKARRGDQSTTSSAKPSTGGLHLALHDAVDGKENEEGEENGIREQMRRHAAELKKSQPQEDFYVFLRREFPVLPPFVKKINITIAPEEKEKENVGEKEEEVVDKIESKKRKK